MQRILNKVTRVGNKAPCRDTAAAWPPQLSHGLALHGLKNLLIRSQQPHSYPFLRSVLNLINEFHGYLLKPTHFINRTDPEVLVGRKVVWFIVIDYFQQKSFWSCKAKQGHKLGEKMNLMPGFIWYKIFIHTGLGPFLAIVINIYLSGLNECSVLSNVFVYWYLSIKMGLDLEKSCAWNWFCTMSVAPLSWWNYSVQ